MPTHIVAFVSSLTQQLRRVSIRSVPHSGSTTRPNFLWLLGSPLGWRGPWGTTYPPNLRLTVQDVSEADWVTLLRTRKALPPMGWMNVNQLAESDARALYGYIRSLGPAGERMPLALPPEQEPTTPYLSLIPVMPGG